MLSSQVSKNIGKLGSRLFSTTHTMPASVVAVVLSGCGVNDGSEIHEASAALASLTKLGADVVCYAPNENQMHVIDHVKGAPAESESRNVMVEAARISRGNIKPLSELSSSNASAVVFPGGFGAAKNLSDFAVNGPSMKVHSDVERIIKDFHESGKPLALCCIAPILAAKILGNKGVQLTLGKSDDGSGKWPFAGSIDVAKQFGAKTVELSVNEVCVDEVNKVVTTPAYMYDGKFHEIHEGVSKMIEALMKMVK